MATSGIQSSDALEAVSAVVDAFDFGVVLIDPSGRVRLWNAWLERFSRRRATEVVGATLQEVFGATASTRLYLTVREALDLGLPTRLSHALHRSPLPLGNPLTSGERPDQAVSVAPFLWVDGSRWCRIEIHDISLKVRRERELRTQARRLADELVRVNDTHEELRRSETRFRELTRQAPVGIFEVDQAGLLLFQNPAWQQMTGVEDTALRSVEWTHIVAVEDRTRLSLEWHLATEARGPFLAEFRCCNQRTMRKFWVRVQALPVRGVGDSVTSYIGTMVDIHSVKEQALEHAQQAAFDTLTGLYNRKPFHDRLELAIQEASPSTRFAVMFVDVNGFKEINDEFGHQAGDNVLKAVARRIRRCLRPDDTVARFGGDEFVVLLGGLRADQDLDAVVAKLRRAIEQPVNIEIRHVQVSCAIGVAQYPLQGRSSNDLLQEADRRMYDDKRNDRMRIAGSSREKTLGALVAFGSQVSTGKLDVAAR